MLFACFNTYLKNAQKFLQFFISVEWEYLDKPVHAAPGEGRRRGWAPQGGLPAQALRRKVKKCLAEAAL